MKSAEEFIVESFLAYPDSLRLALVTETFPPEINGVAMTLGNLVKGLLKRGHAVQVVRPRQAREADGAQSGVDRLGIPGPLLRRMRG